MTSSLGFEELIFHLHLGIPINHLSGFQTNTQQAFLVSPIRDTSVRVLIYQLALDSGGDNHALQTTLADT
jgi:hypothetical protein